MLRVARDLKVKPVVKRLYKRLYKVIIKESKGENTSNTLLNNLDIELKEYIDRRT